MNNLFYVLRTFKLIAKFKLFSNCAMIRTKGSKRGAKQMSRKKKERKINRKAKANKQKNTDLCVPK